VPEKLPIALAEPARSSENKKAVTMLRIVKPYLSLPLGEALREEAIEARTKLNLKVG